MFYTYLFQSLYGNHCNDSIDSNDLFNDSRNDSIFFSFTISLCLLIQPEAAVLAFFISNTFISNISLKLAKK